MKRAGTPRPAPPVAAAAPRAPVGVSWAEITIVLACVAFALWVHRRALGGFFSLDDLVIMEEAHGLRVATPGLWRFVSRYVYFAAAVPLFGSNPFPYHLMSATLHAANLVLLYWFVRSRSGSMLAAFVAAGMFGTSRLHFSAIGFASTVGELLALGLTLGAFLLYDRGRVGAIVAPLLFLGALLSKESVVLLPAVLLLPPFGAGPFGARLRRAAPLLVLGAMFAAALVATGAGEAHLGGKAYARAFGGNVLFNLMTYAQWVVRPGDAFPGQVSAIDYRAWPLGAIAVLGLVTLAIVARRSALPPVVGASWWLLALLPVLPLLHHTYLYYLYVPFAGLTMALAGGMAWLEARAAARPQGSADGRPTHRGPRSAPAAPRWRTSLVWVAAILMVFAHGVNADRLLAQRFAARMRGTGIPLDPDLRKSEIARHTSDAVGRALAGRRGRVAFLLPSSLRQIYSTATGQRMDRAVPDSSSYTMLAGALDDGRGLVALHPNIDSVAFLPGWRPGYADFEIFSQSRDGTVFALGQGPDGFAQAGVAMLRNGDVAPAKELLADALSEFPDHAPLRYEYARAWYLSGDSLAMVRELRELARRAPSHPLADRVRAILSRGPGP
jgi:hypothetical protein